MKRKMGSGYKTAKNKTAKLQNGDYYKTAKTKRRTLQNSEFTKQRILQNSEFTKQRILQNSESYKTAKNYIFFLTFIYNKKKLLLKIRTS